jgi:transcriptional regulator with XRE-family HTH domain
MISNCSRPRGLPRLPKSIDQHFGARIRLRRLMVGMSQTQLAEALEVSSEQVQKYEKGVNQIRARRLQQIARVLRVPLAFFFDGGDGAVARSPEPIRHSNSIAFVMTADDQRLIRAFVSIRDPLVRNNLLLLIESIAANPYGRDPRSNEGAA